MWTSHAEDTPAGHAWKLAPRHSTLMELGHVGPQTHRDRQPRVARLSEFPQVRGCASRLRVCDGQRGLSQGSVCSMPYLVAYRLRCYACQRSKPRDRVEIGAGACSVRGGWDPAHRRKRLACPGPCSRMRLAGPTNRPHERDAVPLGGSVSSSGYNGTDSPTSVKGSRWQRHTGTEKSS